MSFSSDIEQWAERKKLERRDIFVRAAQLVHESIQVGSETTGSPGQPVDLGTLIGSWIISFPSATEALITTNVVYARPIEDGIQVISLGGGKYTYRSPIHFRSAKGGSHSVRLTRAGWSLIVQRAVREVTGRAA